MCFSATASFTSSALLGAIGVMTLSKLRDKKALALALLPLLLAFHQLVEGIVWITQDRLDLAHIQQISSYVFLIIATAVWPTWVPGSVYLLEKDKRKKREILITTFVGVLVSITLLYQLIRDGSVTNVNCNHISYSFISNASRDISFSLRDLVFGGYLFAVIVPFFVSSARFAWLVGLSISLGLIVTLIFYAYAFGSVWCFFGALSSIFIYFVVCGLPRRK